MKLTLHIKERSFLKRFDINFLIVVLALNLVGLINLYSATHGAHTTGMSPLFVSQIFWLVAGWSLLIAITFIDYQFFNRIAVFLFVLNIIALITVVFIGKTYYGAQRWLDLGFFRYQPSETMKVVLVLVLAKILSNKSRLEGFGLKDLIWPTIITLIPFIAVVIQPDLGTSLLLLAVFGSMIMFVGVKRKILVVASLVILFTLPIVWNFGLKDYQKTRILTFMDPGKDPKGSGYNSIQSKIAVGSGMLLGKGFRKGTQSQLEFLPERHTDFIFSVLSEEHGFFGSIITIGLFTILLVMGINIASEARDKFGSLVVVGVLSIIFWHVFINIGMVIGILPIVGVPLPLLSYGGSSMLTTMGALGIISSIAYRKFLF